jgi:hypothetical protein
MMGDLKEKGDLREKGEGSAFSLLFLYDLANFTNQILL